MNTFNKLYNQILQESAHDKKVSKGKTSSYNKHRNKWQTRQASKASRRNGKNEIKDQVVKEDVDYHDLFRSLTTDIEEFIRTVDQESRDQNSPEVQAALTWVVESLDGILSSY